MEYEHRAQCSNISFVIRNLQGQFLVCLTINVIAKVMENASATMADKTTRKSDPWMGDSLGSGRFFNLCSFGLSRKRKRNNGNSMPNQTRVSCVSILIKVLLSVCNLI